jgi:DNA replication protein DnaC
MAMMTEAQAMISENTVMKLHMLKLHAMADEFVRQGQSAETKKLSFDERFSMIVDCEFTQRENNRLTRLIRNAGFVNPGACVEGIDFSAGRKLDNALIQKLASCEYIVSGLNVHILGATGVGKTYLSSALGISACRNSITTKYTRLPDILNCTHKDGQREVYRIPCCGQSLCAKSHVVDKGNVQNPVLWTTPFSVTLIAGIGGCRNGSQTFFGGRNP